MDVRLERVADLIARHYGDRLIGIVLFGSRAGSRARVDSDWDLLCVMDQAEPIRRALYREWDNDLAAAVAAILPDVSPVFVHLPPCVDDPPPLWLEVASCHRVLADRLGTVGARLSDIGQAIEAGRYERRAAHGLSYWRRAG